MDPLFLFVLPMVALGIVGGFVAFLRYIARKYERTIRHRMFDRVTPSRWPQVDYRVGKVCRPRDFD